MAVGERLRAKSYGWAPLLALAATSTLGAGENTSVSQAVNGIQRTFHVSNSTVGLLPVAVSVVAVAGAPPFGLLADRRRRTVVLAGAMLAWTLFEGLNGLAWSFGALLAFRLGVGFAEASGSAAISLVGDYWPVDQRAMRMGWYSAGGIVGALIGFVGGGVAVSVGGWRWAFWFWVPLGVAIAGYLLAQPEPARGHQDADLEADRVAAATLGANAPVAAAEAVLAAEGTPADGETGTVRPTFTLASQLPPPRRVGTLNYRTDGVKEVMRELFRIPSMWWALVSLTVAQCLTAALGFWAVPFFERVDHLRPVAAGAFAGIILPASIAGVLGGGVIADRLFRRGVLNARVYVVVAASLISAASLPLGFATHNLIVSGVFLAIGGCAVTLPIAPSEALFNDVVVADLRGRAASVRSMVRAASSAGSLIVGIMADHLGGSSAGHAAGLQHALVIFAPACGLAGITFIFAKRSYAHDVAFVCAETARLAEARAAEAAASDAARVPGAEVDGRVPGHLLRRGSTVGTSIASAPTGGAGKEGVPGA
ncbi:MAG TPA: MFS transporter [Acidimicrobiales bacterium]|nr:MFS transporter [Acidimicrobiales bacterium]